MEEKQAGVLAESLGKRLQGFQFYPEEIYGLLKSIAVPDNPRFMEKYPNNRHILDSHTPPFYYFLSIRRIIRNKFAEGKTMPPWGRIYDSLVSKYAKYSSDSLTRRLRENPNLVSMLKSSPSELSLLAKLETIDNSLADQTYIMTKPLLVITGYENSQEILDWEQANTVYERQNKRPFLGFNFRRISSDEYFGRN